MSQRRFTLHTAGEPFEASVEFISFLMGYHEPVGAKESLRQQCTAGFSKWGGNLPTDNN